MKSPIISTTASSISSGGTISGDVTISGDLTVSGGGGYSFSEVLSGDMIIDQDANSVALKIDTEATTAHGIWLNNPQQTSGDIIYINEAVALTTGSIISAVSSSSSTGTRNLVDISNTHASATGVNVMKITNNSSNANNASGWMLDLYSTFDSGADEQNGKAIRIVKNDGQAVASGDILGSIAFAGAEDAGNSIQTGARIDAVSEETWDYTNNDASLVFLTTSGNASQSEKMRITSAGKVIIGHTAGVSAGSVTAPLQVLGTGGADTHTTFGRWSADDTSSTLNFIKSRNASIGGNTIVADNDKLGIINFRGNDGTDNEVIGAQIMARVEGTPGSNDMPTELVFSTTLNGESAPKERLYITNNGRMDLHTEGSSWPVGIHSYGSSQSARIFLVASKGTKASPTDIDADDYQLGAIEFYGREDNGNRLGGSMRAFTGGVWNGSSYPTYLTFNTVPASSTSEVERMRIDEAGRVGIGVAPSLDANTPLTVQTASDFSVLFNSTNSGGYVSLKIGNSGDTSDTSNWDIVRANGSGDLAIRHWDTFYSGGTVSTVMNLDANSRIFPSTGTGNNNTLFGYLAGGDLTSSGHYNTFVGEQAGTNSTHTEYNTAVGYQAMHGSDSTAQTGDDNTAFGANSLLYITGGHDNIAVGKNALYQTADGDENIGIGNSAGYNCNLSDWNTLIGHYAGYKLGDTGGSNGSNDGHSSYNTVVGFQAMSGGDDTDANNTANSNVAMGFRALGGFIGGGLYSSDQAAFTANNNVALGFEAAQAITSGATNVAVGAAAGHDITSGSNNVLMGWLAGDKLSTTSQNVVIGSAAGRGAGYADNVYIGYAVANSTSSNSSNNTLIGSGVATTGVMSGGDNTAVGKAALAAITSGANNIAIGVSALTANNTASNNVAIGKNSMLSITDGQRNVAVGSFSMAMNQATTADGSVDNVFIGYNSGGGSWAAAESNQNTAVGANTMDAALNDADDNVAFGFNALTALTSASTVTAVGSGAGAAISTGGNNTVIGAGAGDLIQNGVRNVAVGSDAGNVLVAGENNVIIGHGADAGSSSGSNQTAIGYNAVASQNYETRLGMNGALRWLTWQGEMSTFTNVGDNIAATGVLHELPRYGFLKRITCTVLTASGGTGEYNISLGENVESAGDAVASRTELIGAGSGTQTGAKVRSSLKTADADGLADIVTAKHTFVWEADQTVDDSVGWTMLESGNMYLYVCHANGSNANNATNAILRVTAEYYGED